MLILAAGMNVDLDPIQELRAAAGKLAAAASAGIPPPPEVLAALGGYATRQDLSPETLSAAYARISRDPKPVPALRAEARRAVEKARRSNENIVFGLGHASVAEHAVFNVDVLGISRLAAEFAEHYRLASFTEKSQRYVTLDGDTVTPPEIVGTPLEAEFHQLVQRQTEGYFRLYETLRPRLLAEHPELAAQADGVRTLDGWAKEDARYALSLAVETQLGMTVNARTVERIVRDAANHPLREIRDFGERLLAALQPLAPSLIRYTSPGPFQTTGLPAFVAAVGQRCPPTGGRNESAALPGRPGPGETPFDCRVVQVHGREADVFAALAFEHFPRPYASAQGWAEALPAENSADLLRLLATHLAPWDGPPRAFEMAGAAVACTVSASCFAQLKRHRMGTLISQAYTPGLGITVPPSVQAAGLAAELRAVADQAEALADHLAPVHPALAAYALTNAHRRRVVFSANLREWHHFMRLRLDAHAQWEIRRLAEDLAECLAEPFPVLSRLFAGKDRWPATRQAILEL